MHANPQIRNQGASSTLNVKQFIRLLLPIYSFSRTRFFAKIASISAADDNAAKQQEQQRQTDDQRRRRRQDTTYAIDKVMHKAAHPVVAAEAETEIEFFDDQLVNTLIEAKFHFHADASH